LLSERDAHFKKLTDFVNTHQDKDFRGKGQDLTRKYDFFVVTYDLQKPEIEGATFSESNLKRAYNRFTSEITK